ncbi:hypothetical protein BG31_23195 [Bacillus subtilis subsp. subtilis]|nr:hypothetical protein B4069_0582 [Bacillus subtilis]KIN34734.1 hypothetical protein B4071_0585 [Bacillus subtilis]KIN48095.1 hypothetical protein B4072_0507 [Bacillus subtilis]OTQ81881.1 hypothetical protein BG31_23195 [Bacillus subtilis subsp. subtilis]
MDTNYKKVIRFSIREEEFKVLEEKNTKGVKTLGIFDAALPDRSCKQKKPLYIPVCMIPNL